jgi:hypothetical protein
MGTADDAVWQWIVSALSGLCRITLEWSTFSKFLTQFSTRSVTSFLSSPCAAAIIILWKLKLCTAGCRIVRLTEGRSARQAREAGINDDLQRSSPYVHKLIKSARSYSVARRIKPHAWGNMSAESPGHLSQRLHRPERAQQDDVWRSDSHVMRTHTPHGTRLKGVAI